MPPDKVQHIIRQRGGHVYVPHPQCVSYTLQIKQPKRAMRGGMVSKKEGIMLAAGKGKIFLSYL